MELLSAIQVGSQSAILAQHTPHCFHKTSRLFKVAHKPMYITRLLLTTTLKGVVFPFLSNAVCMVTWAEAVTHAAAWMCRMIERGSHKCDERRRARILTYAPSFGRHGSKAYLDRLVKQAVEGNAWHAG